MLWVSIIEISFVACSEDDSKYSEVKRSYIESSLIQVINVFNSI